MIAPLISARNIKKYFIIITVDDIAKNCGEKN